MPNFYSLYNAKLTGAAARSTEGIAAGHENAEDMAAASALNDKLGICAACSCIGASILLDERTLRNALQAVRTWVLILANSIKFLTTKINENRCFGMKPNISRAFPLEEVMSFVVFLNLTRDLLRLVHKDNGGACFIF